MEKIINFGGLEPEYSNCDFSKIIVVPVCYDGTSTWIKGADKGPDAIIQASANMELYDIETDCEVYKNGIFTEDPIEGAVSTKEMMIAVGQTAKFHLDDGKFVVVIGGEHSVSVGTIRAHAERHGEVTVLQLDAHADLRDSYNGSKLNHACVMARAREICPIVQVGIRSMDSEEKQFMDLSRTFFAKDIQGKDDWAGKVIDKLTDKVYITIDLDVFDPSIMPSVGTPEPGGLLWYETLAFLKRVIETKNVVGFDVVELCPDEGNKAPDFLAAKLIYKLLSYRFGGKHG